MSKTAVKPLWMIVSALLLTGWIIYMFMYPPGEGRSEAVAKVNGTVISRDQLYDLLVSGSGEQALNSLIQKEVIRQEADKAGVRITEEDVAKELDTLKGTFPSDEEFAQTLAMYGMTEEDLKEDLDRQAMLRKLLEPQVTIADDELRQYYDANLEALKTPEQVKAAHILTDTPEAAQAILTELQNGADFAATAKEKSLDTTTKENGGELDYIARGTMEEAFEEAAFALEVGSLSPVVQTSEGYHVIRVTEHKPETTPTFEEKQEELRAGMVNEKIAELSVSWIEEKMAGAAIETYLGET